MIDFSLIVMYLDFFSFKKHYVRILGSPPSPISEVVLDIGVQSFLIWRCIVNEKGTVYEIFKIVI